MLLRSAAAVVLLSVRAYGQIATTTSLVGTVTDASGRLVPRGVIIAVNTGSKDTYHTTTNELGYYSIQFVRIGTYVLTVKHPGFQAVQVSGIQADTNQVVRSDVVLQVGDVVQTIEVRSMGGAIKRDDSGVSEIIGMRNVADMPMNGRDPLRLALMTPGTLPGLKPTNGVPPGQDFIGAGTREIQNSIALDGISIVNNLITTTPTRPSVDSVQEVEVQTGTYSAQYGAYMGVHINVITKSGSNALHGNLVEFLRNDRLDARPYFLSRTAAKSPLRQNQFGFELDGPFYIPHLYDGRNKSFFMGSYEGLRQIRKTSALANIVTPRMFTGDFSQTATVIKDPFANGTPPFAGNIIPASRLSTVALALEQYYPIPTSLGVSNNLAYSTANNNHTDQTVDRFDQNIGDRIRVFFRYQRQAMDLLAGSANPINSSWGAVTSRNYTAGSTHTLTSTLVNDIRFGKQSLTTATLNYFYVNHLTHAGTDLAIPGFNGDQLFNDPGIPEFNLTGFAGWGNGNSNWFQDDTTWQGSEQIGWTHGAHTVMAGAEFRKLETGRTASNSPRGFFAFTGQYSNYAPADFLLGAINTDTSPGRAVRALVAEWRDGFFVLDKWQVSRKLTLNIGLRYELPTVPYTVNGNATELNPQQTALVPANAPVPGFRFIFPNHKDFAPRIGLVYRLTEKTVMRGGYGIYYNPNQINSFTLLVSNPPFIPQVTNTSLSTTPTISFAAPLGATIPQPNLITDNWSLPTAYMNQWSFGLQRELWRNSGLELQYLGSHSLHLDRNYYNNTPLQPGPGAINPRRPNQIFPVSIRTIQNDEIANYEGLSVVARQRMTHAAQFLASYTWSHTLDVSADSNGGGTPMDPYNWRADYGNSNWDIRHRLTGGVVYEVPFFASANRFVKRTFSNWQMNAVFVRQSGLPFNVSYGTDTANTSSGGVSGISRPNLIAPPSSNCGGGHLTACISAASFSPAPFYNYGNAGRNLLHGPGLFNIDYSLLKDFPIRERLKLQFRAELFNALNHPNFNNPLTSFGIGSFGNITATSTENRDIQFGLKLAF